MVDEAQAIGKPKAMYRIGYIESRGDDDVTVDGVTLTSRVLRVNLDRVHRVFPYVATCGTELEELSKSKDDMLEQYWIESIELFALGAATRAVNRDVNERYRPGQTATMNPGSLQDWPLIQQRPLFTLFRSPQASIGVQLTDSLLMVPKKSVSGIRFATEHGFESCQLCPRPSCPGRRAPYDSGLYARKYQLARDE
jgi:hypothetical protein